MKNKLYKIMNNFNDIHTGEKYTTTHKPIEFTDKRVEEIRLVEKAVGYKLIEEVVSENTNQENKNNKDNK